MINTGLISIDGNHISPAGLLNKVEGLSDLELALLLSLVANEHCLIQTEQEPLESLGQELELVRSGSDSCSAPTELLGRLHQISSTVRMLSSTVAKIRA